MNNFIAKLKANTKAYVAGVVTFICTYVVLFAFGIEVTADLQATIASGLSALVAGVLTWLFPNIPPAPPSAFIGGFEFETIDHQPIGLGYTVSEKQIDYATPAERWSAPPHDPADRV